MTNTPLPTGRDLDALVAEKVLGWMHNPPGIRGLGWLTPERKMIGDHALPAFSTDIAAVQLVETKINKQSSSRIAYGRALVGVVTVRPEQYSEVFKVPTWELDVIEVLRLVFATPEQRCLAALKAVGAL